MKGRSLKIFFMGLVMLAAFTAVVMLLWNWIMPAVFGLAAISFWQALGLFVLARILFGGFGFGKGMGMMRQGMRSQKNPMHDKWMKMTPEQRKEFIARRKKFGFGGPCVGGDFHSGHFDKDRFDRGPFERHPFDMDEPKEPEKENE